MQRLNDVSLQTPAVAPAVTSGALTGIAIDATGYSRARFVFHFGANDNTAALSAAGVYASSTSGGPYTAISGAALAAVSSGVLGSKIMVIDTAIPTARPWLKVSGTITLNTIGVSVSAQLYDNVSNPPTHTEQQIVTVG